MKNKINMKREAFTWVAVLVVTPLIDFALLRSIRWGKPWHEHATIILISAICFSLAGFVYDKAVSKNVNDPNQ